MKNGSGVDTKTMFLGISVIIAVIVAIGGLTFNNYLEDKRENERIEEQRQYEQEQIEYEEQIKSAEDIKVEIEGWERDVDYRKCMGKAYDLYIENWNGTCKINGLPDDCGLQQELADDIDDVRARDEQRCFDLYGD